MPPGFTSIDYVPVFEEVWELSFPKTNIHVWA